MGHGWCRPDGCDVTSNSCRVNGFYKDESSHHECSTECLRNTSCVGFAISEETYGVPNRCYVYGRIWQQNVPDGWMEYQQQHFAIFTSSGHIGVTCYKRTGCSNKNGNRILNRINYF